MRELIWCRVLRVSAFAAIAAVGCAPGTISADDNNNVVKLGGVRNVTATIIRSDEAYRITVEMIPVKAFDPATNKGLNLSKARIYAARALAKFLGIGSGKASEFVVHGIEVRESGIHGDHFRMVVDIPRKGVSLAAAPAAAESANAAKTAHQKSQSAESERRPPQIVSGQHVVRVSATASTADFLNRKADYLDTISQLLEAFADEAQSTEKATLAPDDFYQAVGGIEERCDSSFQSLRKSIDDDKLLVSVEQDELVPLLKAAHAATIASLKASVTRFDRRHENSENEKENAK